MTRKSNITPSLNFGPKHNRRRKKNKQNKKLLFHLRSVHKKSQACCILKKDTSFRVYLHKSFVKYSFFFHLCTTHDNIREKCDQTKTHTHTQKKSFKKKCIWGRSETGMNEEINVYHLKHTWHTCWFSSLQIPSLVCPHILSPTTFNTDSNNYMTSFRAFVGTPFITNFYFSWLTLSTKAHTCLQCINLWRRCTGLYIVCSPNMDE